MKKVKKASYDLTPALFVTEDDQPKMIATLGHELKIGDSVEFNAAGHIYMGMILQFEKGKCVIQTRACRYKDEAELEEIKKKAKRTYKVAPDKCYKLEKRNK